MIRDVSMRDQVCPLVLWVAIICFRMSRISHCWMIISRLLMKCLEVGISKGGNKMTSTAAGRPSTVGVMNGVNRLSFILVLRVWRGVLVWWVLVGWVGGGVNLVVLAE